LLTLSVLRVLEVRVGARGAGADVVTLSALMVRLVLETMVRTC